MNIQAFVFSAFSKTVRPTVKGKLEGVPQSPKGREKEK